MLNCKYIFVLLHYTEWVKTAALHQSPCVDGTHRGQVERDETLLYDMITKVKDPFHIIHCIRHMRLAPIFSRTTSHENFLAIILSSSLPTAVLSIFQCPWTKILWSLLVSPHNFSLIRLNWNVNKMINKYISKIFLPKFLFFLRNREKWENVYLAGNRYVTSTLKQ